MKKRKFEFSSDAEISQLESRIGYVFKNKELIRTALVHKSASDGLSGFVNNERLEWLGDRVLGLITSNYLFHHHPNMEEGALTRQFNNIVNGNNCAAAAQDIGIDKLLITSKSIQSDDKSANSVNSDAYEALLGALYLDGGLKVCEKVFEIALQASKSHNQNSKNYKSLLQEWAQKRGFDAPSYIVVERSGPDHAPSFLVEVKLNKAEAKAWGKSKQLAEQSAAEILYKAEVENGR